MPFYFTIEIWNLSGLGSLSYVGPNIWEIWHDKANRFFAKTQS